MLSNGYAEHCRAKFFLIFWHVVAQVSVGLCCADAQLHDFEGLGRRW